MVVLTAALLVAGLAVTPLHRWSHARSFPAYTDPFRELASASLLESHLRCMRLGELVRLECNPRFCEADFTPPWFGDPHQFAPGCTSTASGAGELLVTLRVRTLVDGPDSQVERWTATVYPPTGQAREEVGDILRTVYGVRP